MLQNGKSKRVKKTEETACVRQRQREKGEREWGPLR